jgi:elongation factor 1-gamma
MAANKPPPPQAQAAANLNGLDLSVPEFAMGKTNRTDEFLAKFPFGKVPTFEGADGTTLFESDAIVEYIALSGPAAGQLMGSTPAEKATIRQWICFAQGEVLDVVTQLALWRLKIKPYDEATETNALQRIERSLAFLDTHLKGRTWLAGEGKISMADITVASALVWGFSMIIDAEMRTKCPLTVAWYERVIAVDGVKEAFGEAKFIEKRQPYEG